LLHLACCCFDAARSIPLSLSTLALAEFKEEFNIFGLLLRRPFRRLLHLTAWKFEFRATTTTCKFKVKNNN